MNTLVLNQPVLVRLKLKINFKTLYIISFVSIILLLVLYIVQVNVLTAESYLLEEKEIKLAELKKEKEALEISFSEVNSLVNIENYFQDQNFVKVNPEQIKYIRLRENYVRADKSETSVLED